MDVHSLFWRLADFGHKFLLGARRPNFGAMRRIRAPAGRLPSILLDPTRLRTFVIS